MLADRVCFEDRYELQPRERRLLVDGRPVALGARAFDVLLALVERAGALVSKNELLEQVWTGRVVEEANLTVQVSSLRKVLGGELIATIPGRGYRFTGRPEAIGGARPTQVGSDASSPADAGGPGATSQPARCAAPGPTLVGRDADLDQLRTALATPGCVTLVGPAGVGKTSLARAAAAAWPAGAVWVDLAPLAEAPQVLVALARAMGLPPPGPDNAAAVLLRALGDRLLVLDNAEHLIDAAATLVAQLTQAQPTRAQPALSLLVTCQLPLAVPHERVQRVEPLALGDDAEGGALALFVERARAADHRFAPAAGHLPLLHAICRQLDGLPLALEMAAARVPALGLKGLHDALEQRFAVLTRGARTAAQRHRTLHAALDWSHGLLQPEEQRLFRALGVFAGGFTLDLMVAVAGDEGHERWTLIDTLASLVDRSLVTADAGGEVDDAPRYRLLETQRAYAIERLDEAGEQPALRLRHAQAMLALFSAAYSQPGGDRLKAAALAEHDNVREAIVWAVPHAPAIAVRLAGCVCTVATFSAWRLEALVWLEASEPAVTQPAVDAAARAHWWRIRAGQLVISERPEAAVMAEHARRYCLETGDAHALFLCDMVLLRAVGTPDALLTTAIAEMQALHDAHPDWQPRSSLHLHGALAAACHHRGDPEGQLRHRLAEFEAAIAGGTRDAADAAETNIVSALNDLERYAQALARSQALIARLGAQDSGNGPYVWSAHFSALIGLGRHDEVRACAPRFWALLKRYERPYLACEWAKLLAAEGRHEHAARITGFLLQACASRDLAVSTRARTVFDQVAAVSRSALGSESWLRHVDEGRGFDETRAFTCLCGPP